MDIKNYQMIFALSSDILSNIAIENSNDLFISMMAISSNISGNVPVNALGATIEIPEPGTYFLCDLTGDMIGQGYLSAVEGEIFIDITDPDVLNNPNYIVGIDLLGPNTLLFGEKLTDSFLPVEQIVGSTVRMNMVSWSPEDFGEGSASMEMIVPEEFLENAGDILLGDDGISYVLLMDGGLPLMASINSTLETFGGML